MVIPYQVPGVWAYFNAFLPSGITKCDYLVYSQRDEEYKAFKNLTRADDEVEMRKTHEELTEWLEMYER